MAETTQEKAPINPNKQLRWDPEAVIEVSGVEFFHLNNIAQAFAPLVAVSNEILGRMVKSGIATYADDNQTTKPTETNSVAISEAPKEQVSTEVPTMKVVES